MTLARACIAGALALASCASPASSPRAQSLRGLVPFAWPRDGAVTLMTCRFETAQPIGVYAPALAPEQETAVDAVLKAWEQAGLGVRFIRAPREHAQIELEFRDDALAGEARSVVDCALRGEPAEIVHARVEIALRVASARGAERALAREELLGMLAREIAHALGWLGDARPGDAARRGSLAEAARVGARIRAGQPLASAALSALYAQPSGSVVAKAAATPLSATRPVDRLARLAEQHSLAGPFLRTGRDAGRVFWRDTATGDEYGAQVVAHAKLLRAPGAVQLALEPRARRALPRSRDAASD
ncbi:MAG: hypothetical protein FJ091_20410 [Deltaproteobacteria bacterium]|nr:hypothetical protein [Deltaproteobacteria bacterium]